MKHVTIGLCGMLAALLLPGGAANAAEAGKMQLFSLSDVRLLDGPFKSAQQVDLDYILAHDPDRLLAPFRREAGLPKTAEPYGNWESSGLDGHTAGHYLGALAMMYASTGNAEMKQRMDHMVAGLAECQKANGNGYVGGVPGSKALWTDVAAGKLKINGFGVNDHWVPWYNLHKTYAGLRDAYLIGKNHQARDVLVGMGDWCVELISHLSDAQLQDMLRAEHGGMTESLADIYAITGDHKYLDAARRFSDHQILDPLVAGRDELTGKHANTQIPKVIGFERIAALTSDARQHRAALNFWDNVTAKRSVSIGGNSVNEHFNPTNDFKPMIEDRTGPETCNTYNMLRLTEALYQAGADSRYAEFYERALFNHILSTQDPQHGGFVYFTPMRPNHYRVYSTAGNGFWCCVGTGFENHAKYGEFIYAHDDDSITVNLFIASEVNWNARGLTLRQETSFPDQPRSHLVMKLKEPATFTLKIRQPAWLATSTFAVRVSGEAVDAKADATGYVSIRRTWKEGDTIDIDLPMKMQAEALPDGSNYVSFRYGPIVLAAATSADDQPGLFAGPGRGDHIAEGALKPLYEAPTLIATDVARLAEQLTQPDPRQLVFRLPANTEPATSRDLKLIPFFRLHESRYFIYWPFASADHYAQQRQQIELVEREKLALEKATIDHVIPGAQQSEVDHAFKGEATNNGTHQGRGWRDAHGWFSYELKSPGNEPADLLLTFYGGDRDRKFEILVDNQKITAVELDGKPGNRFITRRFPLPAQQGNAMTVKFVAAPGSVAGGLYELRLVRRDYQNQPR